MYPAYLAHVLCVEEISFTQIDKERTTVMRHSLLYPTIHNTSARAHQVSDSVKKWKHLGGLMFAELTYKSLISITTMLWIILQIDCLYHLHQIILISHDWAICIIALINQFQSLSTSRHTCFQLALFVKTNGTNCLHPIDLKKIRSNALQLQFSLYRV